MIKSVMQAISAVQPRYGFFIRITKREGSERSRYCNRRRARISMLPGRFVHEQAGVDRHTSTLAASATWATLPASQFAMGASSSHDLSIGWPGLDQREALIGNSSADPDGLGSPSCGIGHKSIPAAPELIVSRE